MPTAIDLRQRADLDLVSARAILANDPDNASHLAGLAAEKALKARYCGQMGWPEFPGDRAELKRRGGKDCFIHDLTKLLKLSDSIRIAEFESIDWNVVADWRVESRYQSVGSVSPERASKQVEETAALLEELKVHELIGCLVKAKVRVAAEKGGFNVYALAKLSAGRGWHLMYSAEWFGDSNIDATHKHILAVLSSCLPADLAPMILNICALFSDDRTARAITSAFTVDQANGFFFLGRVVIDECLIPDMYVIESRPFSSP